jgi:hypothetical protein
MSGQWSGQFPLWCVVATDSTGKVQQRAEAAVFSSVDSLTRWLNARTDEHNWHVSVLNKETVLAAMNDLRRHGCREVHSELQSQQAQVLSLDDFIKNLSNV